MSPFIKNKINQLRMLLDLNAEIYTSEQVKIASTELGKYLDEIVKSIKIPTCWDSANFFELEVKKSFARGLLRSSKRSMNLMKAIFSNNDLSNLSKAVNFSAPPYPIIHLASDLSEPGGFHIDQINQSRYMTIWTPTTQNEYAALSNLKGGLISWKFINYKKLPKLTLPIESSIGDCLIFGGGFVHRGNLNTSKKISSASVIRMSKEPIMYEKVGYINNIKDFGFQTIAFEPKDIKNVYKNYSELVDLIIKISKSSRGSVGPKNMITSIKNLLEEFGVERNLRPSFSFSLAMLAQRLSTYKTSNRTANLTIGINIASILLGAENLGSIEYLIKNLSIVERKEFLSHLVKADVFNLIPVDTQQWQRVTQNPNYKNYRVWLL
jgi:hypothetical protein